MYKDQPAEGTAGRTDAEIAQIADDLGVPADVADDVHRHRRRHLRDRQDEEPTSTGTWRTFAPWIAAATNQAGSTA